MRLRPLGQRPSHLMIISFRSPSFNRSSTDGESVKIALEDVALEGFDRSEVRTPLADVQMRSLHLESRPPLMIRTLSR